MDLLFFRKQCSFFIDGIRKRSWLQMLNPLSRHNSTVDNELSIDGNDLEIPSSSPDTGGYIGKILFISLIVLSMFHFVLVHVDQISILFLFSLFLSTRLKSLEKSFLFFMIFSLIAMNHKTTTTIHLDEINPPTNKNMQLDQKLSQQSSTSSNNLLKPDSNPWGIDSDLLRNKSQSISNIAGKISSLSFVIHLLM